MATPESLEALIRDAVSRLDAAGATASEVRNGALRAVQSLASLAVNAADTPETARKLLESYEARRVVQRLLEASDICHGELCRNPKTGPTPDGGIAANGPSSVAVHLAWLLDERAAAARMVEIALDPAVIARLPKAKLWGAYFAVLQGVARKTPVELPRLAPKGLEKYWLACMELAAALARQTDTTALAAAAQAEFAKLNRDKRVTDWLAVDGDGHAPVRWSLRIASLLGATPVIVAG
jgi:hypothetical protein